MSSCLRVVFDTNAFTPDTFGLLDRGPMRALCRAGRIVPVYGHVFLEETFRAYGAENKRQQLVQNWLPFIAATVARFCDDFIGIWHRELVQGHGQNTNFFMPRRFQNMLLAGLPKIPLDGSWRAWHNSEQARNVDNAKRAAQREISKDIRSEVADWRKAVRYHPKEHGISGLSDFFEREVDHFGRQLLPTVVQGKNLQAVADRWANAKPQYPFFTTFVVGMLYIAHHAMGNPNDRIDPNAQADLDLMAHLMHADALVSNETGFLRQAFEDLWRPRGKVIFNSQQFAELIRKF